MSDNGNKESDLGTLLGRTTRTGIGLLRNRAELFSVEWQEQKVHMAEMLLWGAAVVFLGVLGVLMLTGFIILLFKEEYRIYAAAGFALLYLAGAGVAFAVLKKNLHRQPFEESVDQLKKDAQWLESLK
jgi:uncharacterized membrane protein YqjE